MRGKVQLGTPETPILTDFQRGLVTVIDGGAGVEDALVWIRKNAADAIEMITLPDSVPTTTITVQGGDSTVDAAVTTLDFDSSDFNVTSSPAGEANVSLAYGTSAGTPAEGNHNHTGVYAASSHTHPASDVVSGLLDNARIATGTPDGKKFLRDDQVWAAPSASGSITVQEGDVTVDAAVTVVDFDSSDFNITSSPAGEANVALNYGTSANQPAEGNHTHAYSPVMTISEGGTPVDSALTIINFDSTDFNVSSSPAGTGNVSLNYGTTANVPAEGNHTHALDDLSDVDVASPGSIPGKVLAWDGTSAYKDHWVYTETLGPWYLNDVPGTANTAMGLSYFNTATAKSRSTNPLRVGRVGYIVGARITSDAARTAGTCTVQVLLNGAATAFDGGSVVLDGTRTTQDASIVAPSSGIAVTSGSDTIGVRVVTSGWTPITANIFVTLMIIYDAIA